MLPQLLLTLGLCCAVFADSCKTPEPMGIFSMTRFSGSWYEAAYDANLAEVANATCGIMQFHTDNIHGQYRWNVQLQFGETYKGSFYGTYFLPDPSKGVIKTKLGDNLYDFTVLCTDYVSWTAIYACVQLTPNSTSEIIALLLRDVATYSEVVSKQYLQRCYRDVTTKPVKELTLRINPICTGKLL